MADPAQSKTTSQVVHFIKSVREAKLPIFIVATTNYPALGEVKRFEIAGDGSSSELDSVLARRVDPILFRELQPCYLFHEKSLGTEFATEYIGNLKQAGRIDDEFEINTISKYSRGLVPVDIMLAFSDAKQHPICADEVCGKFATLKLESQEIAQLARLIRSKIESLLLDEDYSIQESIDYNQLALVVEDIPIQHIAQVLDNASKQITEAGLRDLLSKCDGYEPRK